MGKRQRTRESNRQRVALIEWARLPLALALVFALAIAALYWANRVPPRIIVPSSPTATVKAGEAFTPRPATSKKTSSRGFSYMFPRAGPAPTGVVPYLEGMRSAGLLRGYSVPPDKLVFTPGGGMQYLPVTEVAKGPRPPVAVTHGDRAAMRVALTFDDGYYGLGDLLDTLTDLRVPATIFLTAGAIKGHTSLVRLARERGFEVADHTCTHTAMLKLPTPVVVREIADCGSCIADVSGAPPAAYFRPPGGAFDARIEQVAASLGYVVVTWTHDTEDWRPTTTADQLFQRATQGVRGGDIILMHTQGVHTKAVLPRIVRYLRGKGFELTTVSGVLE